MPYAECCILRSYLRWIPTRKRGELYVKTISALGLGRDIPTVDEIRPLKDLDPSTLVGKLTSFSTSRMRQPITVASTQEYQCQGYAKRGSSAETIGYVAQHRNHPFRHHRTNTRGNHNRNFNSAHVVRYLAT
jgi:hypothetical protein